MRVVDQLDAPGMHSAYGDADLFLQLAAQRGFNALTTFELAPWEFPIAFVDLAGRAGGQ